MAKSKLTAKQQLFVLHYRILKNATKAAEEAGYSKRTAYSQGQRLLKHVEIQRLIETEEQREREALQVTADDIARELYKIGFSNMLDYTRATERGDLVCDFSKLTRDQAAAIAEVTSEIYVEGVGADAERVKRTKFKLADKKSALVELAKLLGFTRESGLMLPDGSEVTFTISGPKIDDEERVH